MSDLVRLDPRVTSVGALRLDGSPTGVTYEARGIDADTQEDRHRAVEHIFRMAAACGMVGEHRADDYAVLEGYDDGGDIVADYGIRSRRGFTFLYRKLGWRVLRPEGSPADA